MCKYCDGSETPLARQETDHRDAEIRIEGNTLIADLRHDYLTAEIDFCPKCGTPLGEVKPLTVEQLKEMESGNYLSRWVYIKIIDPDKCVNNESAYYRTEKDYTDSESFYCNAFFLWQSV